MHRLTITIEVIFALYVLDKIGLWLEWKGWLYYRKTKPSNSVSGSVLQELNALLNPSDRHVIGVHIRKASSIKADKT